LSGFWEETPHSAGVCGARGRFVSVKRLPPDNLVVRARGIRFIEQTNLLFKIRTKLLLLLAPSTNRAIQSAVTAGTEVRSVDIGFAYG
jgi:hypothetical protein